MENERETATFKRVSDFEIMGFQPKTQTSKDYFPMR